MRNQLHIFLNAVMFFTRIPVPKWTRYNADLLHQSAMYFPLIGLLVGAFSAAVYVAAALVLPLSLAVLLSMAASILLTGGFHEDGLADTCDGFGGGWRRDDILRIMRDSRLGTFGALGLLLAISTKWASLLAMPAEKLPFILIAGHGFSRLAATSLIRYGSYAREDDDSKSKPLATEMTSARWLVAVAFGLIPLMLLTPAYTALALLPLLPFTLWLYRYFRRWIDGYTGDCLGATQQLTEVLYYLSLLGIFRCLVP